MSAVIGIDIGGTSFRIGTVDEHGAVSRFRKLPTASVFCTGDVMGDLTGFLQNYCADLRPEAVAIGFPATLDRERRTVLQAPNVPFMERLPVAEVLSAALGLPVFLERDVTMALLRDCQVHGIAPRGVVCGIYYGTGIGNAISIQGQPLVGCHGTAGELGHIPVDGSAIPCGCGNVGCLENLACGKYLAALAAGRFAGTPVGELFLRHGDEPELRCFVDRMAAAAAAELNILDPDWLLIGGGVPSMAGFPRERFVELVRQHTRKPWPAEDLRILFTGDAEEKCVLGAALYARQSLSGMIG